ncbi:hypothetical protein KKD37_04725, partial [Patescibacteria group bacterium]|nr:hypothetical protein [Patescibacteria group bacterium]
MDDSYCTYLNDPPTTAPDGLTQCWEGVCDAGHCEARIASVCDVLLEVDNCCEYLGLRTLFFDGLNSSTIGEQTGGEFVAQSGKLGFYPSGNGYIRYATDMRINPVQGAVCMQIASLINSAELHESLPSFFFSEEGADAHLRLWTQNTPPDELVYSKMDNGSETEAKAEWFFSTGMWGVVSATWDGSEQGLLMGRMPVDVQPNENGLTDVGENMYLGNHPSAPWPTTSTEFVIDHFAVCGEPLEDTTCGNEFVDPGEECDGADWGDITDCTDFGIFEGGTLSCNTVTCRFDTSDCAPFTPPTC